jgi:hypothetical protein
MMMQEVFTNSCVKMIQNSNSLHFIKSYFPQF